MSFCPGTPATLGPIIMRADRWLKWSLNQSCSPRGELCNGMLHATYMQGNRGDLRVLVVESQIDNLIPNLSFGYSLCVKCPNGSCKPILNIYVPKDFQWYKELLNLMGFDPWNHSLKIWECTKTPTPKVGTHLGVWGFIPSHSLALSRAWNVILGFHTLPIILEALALVANTRLGLQQAAASLN
jgi:hypothetical protein